MGQAFVLTSFLFLPQAYVCCLFNKKEKYKMTDRSKYSNVSLSNKTYEALKKLSQQLLPGGTPLSISKTVETLVMERISKIAEKSNK